MTACQGHEVELLHACSSLPSSFFSSLPLELFFFFDDQPADVFTILDLWDRISGFFWVVHVMPPAATRSRVRHCEHFGQRPLCSRAHPFGLEKLDSVSLTLTQQSNAHCEFEHWVAEQALPGDVRHSEASAGESCVNLPRWMHGGLWESCRTFLDYWRCYTWRGRLSQSIAPCKSTRPHYQNRAILCLRRNSSTRRMKSSSLRTRGSSALGSGRFKLLGWEGRAWDAECDLKNVFLVVALFLALLCLRCSGHQWVDAAATHLLQSVRRQVFGVACHW